MFGVVMAQVSRCAIASMCPTDQDLKEAIYDRTAEAAAKWTNAYRAEHPDEIVWADPLVIGKISNVHCGDKSLDEPGTVNCSYSVMRASNIVYVVAKMTLRDGRWTILDELAVTRRSRSRPRS
jgi:hypothetical protein